MIKNQRLIDIYEDTKKISKKITKSSKTDLIDSVKSFDNIHVVPQDTITAAIDVKRSDYYANIILLNMASYKRAGGGVANGSKAQEEDLFRCTNLCELIPQDFYPLKEGSFLYTSKATIIKDKSYNTLNSSNRVKKSRSHHCACYQFK